MITRETLSTVLNQAGFGNRDVHSLLQIVPRLSYDDRRRLLLQLAEAASAERGIELDIPTPAEEEDRTLHLDRYQTETAPLCFVRDPSLQVRRTLAGLLAESDWSGRIPVLSILLEDRDRQVRDSARRGLPSTFADVVERSRGVLAPEAPTVRNMVLGPPEAIDFDGAPPTVVRRFTDLGFKARREDPSRGDLEITLRIERDSTGAPLDIRVPPGKRAALLHVHASSEHLDVRPTFRRIWVPRKSDSETAAFELRAVDRGPGQVHLTLWDEYRLIGSLLVDLEARGKNSSLELVLADQQIFLDPANAGVGPSLGVTIQVSWADSRDRHIEYWAHLPETQDREVSFVPLGRSAVPYDPHDSRAPLAQLRSRIDQILQHLDTPEVLGVSSRDDVLETLTGDLQGIGRQISNDLLSEEVRSLLFASRSSVQWAVKEPELDTIPWELVCMPLTCKLLAQEDLVLVRTPIGPNPDALPDADAADGGSTDDGAAENPRLTYLLGKGVGTDEHFPRLARVIEGIEDRYELVTNFLSEKGWEDLDRGELRRRVAGSEVVHLLCHGRVDPQSGLSLEIGSNKLLGDFRPTDAWSLELAPGALVMVNACSSAASGLTPAGIRSFGWNFIRAGASLYVGTLAPVTTPVALAFARAFFDARIRDGLELAKAIRRARRVVADSSDPTWMFYAVYGDLTQTM